MKDFYRSVKALARATLRLSRQQRKYLGRDGRSGLYGGGEVSKKERRVVREKDYPSGLA